MSERVYKNILLSGVAAILTFSVIARGAVRLWSGAVVLLASFTLIFLWLMRINNRSDNEKKSFFATALVKPIIILAVTAVVSLFFSICKHDSIYALLWLLGYAGIYYLIANEFDHKMVKGLLHIAVTIGAGISLYGLMQYFGIFPHRWWMSEDLVSATYVNHNHFAG